eukprot:UN07744
MCNKVSTLVLCALWTSVIVYRQICNAAIQRFAYAFAHSDARDFKSLEDKLKPLIQKYILPTNVTLST